MGGKVWVRAIGAEQIESEDYWAMRRSHSWDGKLGSQEAKPAQR